MAADALYLAAAELLDACVLILDTETTLGAPSTRFVTPGDPADDCDMLTVQVRLVVEEDTSPTGSPGITGQRHRFQRVNKAEFVIRVIRCVQTSAADGSPASPTVQDANARVVLSDIWALWNGLMRMKRDDILLNGLCGDVAFGPADPVPLLGAVGGWNLLVTAAMDGYSPALGTP